MRRLVIALILFGSFIAAEAQAGVNSFPAQSFTATSQTGTTLNASGYSYATVAVNASALTTATITLRGSNDGGIHWFIIPTAALATPTTLSNSQTVTTQTMFGAIISAITNLQVSTSGTFTATGLTVKITASSAPGPVVGVQGGGGGSMTWPAAPGIANYAGSNAWGTSYSASNTIPANFISALAYATTPATTSPLCGNTAANSTIACSSASIQAAIGASVYAPFSATAPITGNGVAFGPAYWATTTTVGGLATPITGTLWWLGTSAAPRASTTGDTAALSISGNAAGLSAVLATASGGTGEAGTFTGIRKANSAGADTAAVAGTDYQAPGAYLMAPVANASLANPATTVNGQTCTLGATCALPLSATGTITGTTTLTFTCPANNAPAFFPLTLSQNVTSSTLALCGANQPVFFRITQASGIFTIVLPANITQQPLIPTVGGQFVQFGGIFDGTNIANMVSSTTGPANSPTTAPPGYNPPSGNIFAGYDPTNLNLWVLNPSGNTSYTLFPLAAVAHNFITSILSTGVAVAAQPSSADLSDVGNIAFKNVVQTFTVKQSFTSGSVVGALNIVPSTTVPSTPVEGDFSWNSNTGFHRPYYYNGTSLVTPLTSSDEITRTTTMYAPGSGALSTSTFIGGQWRIPTLGGNQTTASLTVTQTGGTCVGSPILELRDLGTSQATSYASSTLVMSITTGTSNASYYSASANTMTANHFFQFAVGSTSGACATDPTFYITLVY